MGNSMLSVAAAFLLRFLVLVLWLEFVGRFLVSYRLKPDRIEAFMYFGLLRFDTILFSDLQGAYIIPGFWAEIRQPKLLFTTHWSLRLTGPRIVLEKRRGMFRRGILTPDDAPRFLEEIRRHLPK